MQFTYNAIDKNGIRTKNNIEANSEREVIDYLRTNGLTPLSVKKFTKSSFLNIKHAKNSDVVLFTRQLSSMILTGLTLIESLKILEQQITSPAMKIIIRDLISQISEGATFSDALSQHKETFSPTYIALIKAAERGGVMDKVLLRLADNMEKSDELKSRVKSAMFYPAIVIVGMVVVLVVMNVFVIPQLGTLYENLNLKLPLTTQLVLAFSKAFTDYYLIIGALLLAAFIGYKRMEKTPAGVKIIDRAKLRTPVLGKIIELSILDETTRTLSLMIASGASIIESLNLTANVANNYWYKTAINTAATQVEKGLPLSTSLSNQNLFPPMLIQMARVGESTGKIDDSLNKVAEYFDRDLDIRVHTLTTAIEPILLIVLGLSVAFLILSVITPIYGLISQIN